MNRYFFDLIYFHIKKEKVVFLVSLAVIYLLGLTICINTLNTFSLEGESSIILCFNKMQKVLLPMVLIIQSILFRPYVDTKYRELIFSLDQIKKWNYIFIYMICIEVILLPFYLVLYSYCRDMGVYLLLITFQIFILLTLYYGVSMITKSTLISVGILMMYLFFFSFLHAEPGIGSFLLINMSIDRIPISYYMGSISIALVVMILGGFFERKFSKL